MTDKDIVDRIAQILNSKVLGPYKPQYTNAKTVWYTQVSGKKALTWMLELFPYMGIRRRARIAEVLERWEHAS